MVVRTRLDAGAVFANSAAFAVTIGSANVVVAASGRGGGDDDQEQKEKETLHGPALVE